LVVGGGQVLVVAGRFATLWWLTRLLDPMAFGEVALIQGVAALGLGTLCGPLLHAGLRFHATAATDGSEHALMSFMRPLVMRVAWITAVAVVAGAFIWRIATGSQVSLWALVGGLVVIVPDVARTYELTVFNATRRQSAYAMWNVADAFVRPLGAIAAIELFGRSSSSALWGFCAAAIIVNVICSKLLVPAQSKIEHGSTPPETRRQIIRFALPLVALSLMAWIVGVADRYVLAETAGAAAAGLYSAVYGVGSQGFLSLGLIGLTAFRPLYFEAVDARDMQRGRRILWLWLAVMAGGSAAGVAGLVVVGETVARLCLGSDFQAAAPLLPWIGAAYAFHTLQTVFEVLLYAKHRTAPLLVIQVAGALVALVLYVVLIPRYGAFGAVLATMASFAVSCGMAATIGDLVGVLRRAEPLDVNP